MSEVLAAGTRIADRYIIEALIEKGAHEQLYRAATTWGQAVLLTTFQAPHTGTPTGTRIRQVFIRNARLLAQVQHASVVRVMDMLEEPERQIVVFGDRRATSLREATRGAPIAPAEIFKLVETAFQALAAAHSQALLHHRITPEHLWFDAERQLVLGHFGLATRALAERREADPPDPRYAAPELLGGGLHTPQTDVYALSAVLLEAVTGVSLPPASARQQGVPLPVPDRAVPSQVMEALTEGLRLDPAARAVSASEVLERLRRPDIAVAAPMPEPPRRAVATPPADAGPRPAPAAAPSPPPRPARSLAPLFVAGAALALVGGLVLSGMPRLFAPASGPTTRAQASEAPPSAAAPSNELAAESALTPPSTPVLRREVVNTLRLNLRGQPSSAAPVLTTLPRGASLGVLADQGEWLKVSAQGGKIGWVNAALTLPLRTPDETALLLRQVQGSGTVQLQRGAYELSEPLVLAGQLTLSGAGPKATLLFSAAAEDTVIIRVAEVTLENLGIAHIGTQPARALLQEGGRLTLSRVALSGTVRNDETSEFGSGLWVKDAGYADIQNATFSGNVFGLYVSDSSSVDVTASTFTGNRDGGLLFKDSAVGRVADCTIQENAMHGVHVSGQATPEIVGNLIRGNRGRGITVFGNATPTIRSNTIEENVLQGIGIQGAAAPDIVENIVQGNEQSGITFFDNATGAASDNTVQANQTAGIRITEYAAPSISGNTVTRNRENGIAYSEFASGTAANNEITENAKPGIAAWGDAQPRLSGNVVSRNRQSGIVMAERSSGQVHGNQLTGNSLYGLIVTGSASPEVTENTVSGNLSGGIFYKQDATGSGYGNTCYGNGTSDLSADLNPDNAGPSFQQDGCASY